MSDSDAPPHGFSGLGSLADDVPEKGRFETSSAKKPPGDGANVSEDSHPEGATPTSSHTDENTSDSAPGNGAGQSSSSSSSSGGWWVIGIGVVAIVIGGFVLGRPTQTSTIGERASNWTRADSTVAKGSSPQIGGSPLWSEFNNRTQYRLDVDKPPAGKERILGLSQIRWCIREEIRIQTLAEWGNAYIDAHNKRVDEYNSRCGEYRYRVGNLARARRDVSEYRPKIVAELQALYANGDNRQSQVPTDKLSKALVREIQSRLNARGFAAGPTDGLMGPKTASAIRNYQRSFNLSVTGQPSRRLLESLRSNTRTDFCSVLESC